MDSKAAFIIGICGFLTALAFQLGTLEHGWADARSPAFVSSVLMMVASFIMTAYGGATLTTDAKKEEMVGIALKRLLEQQALAAKAQAAANVRPLPAPAPLDPATTFEPPPPGSTP